MQSAGLAENLVEVGPKENFAAAKGEEQRSRLRQLFEDRQAFGRG
jgi:hypothetical protein